jgi:hypothetical protein
MAKITEPSSQPAEPISDLVWALKYVGGAVAVVGLFVSLAPLVVGLLSTFTDAGAGGAALGAIGSIYIFAMGFAAISLGGILHVLVKILEELKSR